MRPFPDTPAPERPEPRFIADCMLGKLAKWLRILGYDTRYDPAASDEEIVHTAVDENRIILTRDTRLVERRLASRHLLIESHIPSEQLRQVVRACGIRLDEARILSRCLPCNLEIQAVDRAEVEDLVPPYVFRTQQAFARCPGCGRIYWGATHMQDIRRRLGRILGAAGPGEEPPEERS